MPIDVETKLAKVAALRVIVRDFPLLPAPLQVDAMRRFHELVAAPETATADDANAIHAGWREWWRDGRVAELAGMAWRLPMFVIDADLWVMTYAFAARDRLLAR